MASSGSPAIDRQLHHFLIASSSCLWCYCWALIDRCLVLGLSSWGSASTWNILLRVLICCPCWSLIDPFPLSISSQGTPETPFSQYILFMISLGIKEGKQTKSVHLFRLIRREFQQGWKRKRGLCSCRSQMARTLAIRCIRRGQLVSLKIKLLFYLQLLGCELSRTSYPLLWEKNTNKERFGHNLR